MDLQTLLGKLFANAGSVGLTGTFQFIFDATHACWFEAGGRGGSGRHAAPDVTIEVATPDFMGIMGGQANVEELFATGRLKIDGNLGLATLLPQAIDMALNGASAPRVEANRRYPPRPRLSDALSASQPPLLSVERRAHSSLSVEAFRERYMLHGIPVVISDALQDWPLFTIGRQASLELFANLQGITRHGDYVKKTFSTERDFRSTSMAEFIASLDAPAPPSRHGQPPAYMGNNILPAQLLEHIRYPRYFNAAQFIPPRIWIGPKGTLTPLHRDDSDNLFAQVWGEKSFILAAPHHRDALGCWATSPDGGLEGCDVDPKAPDPQRFPGCQAVHFMEVVLQAGDLLFLPEGWFHQVESRSTSLSVNFWVDSGRGWRNSPLPGMTGQHAPV
ncbi:cupin [Pseudomonas sp. SWI6]|uniref:Cupin-like domain-containing protein n=1 Tax=Pseudomonas taiwanensis TaxID=470150 RepID=A0ABR6V293_9PSED|nr:cupin-like domain-containing protein [Pseudomonas sp. SWI6]AVD82823.1 cupin [Pseudomonas sp. SWI6]MBC3474320.1 cupin-like domain-containing protein [Pseudomonas taiwanensis]MBC3491769.1 cupin-like domain-containing protein [Pseudomonas taiwanensis]